MITKIENLIQNIEPDLASPKKELQGSKIVITNQEEGQKKIRIAEFRQLD